MASYAGYHFTAVPLAAAMPDTTPACTRNLEACFAALEPVGDFLAAHVNRSVKPDRYTHKNYGQGRAKIHFQGLQRARDGQHAFLSGGDSREKASHLFTLRLGSRAGGAGWCSNLLGAARTPAEDGVVSVLALSDEHWHGGGMQCLGDLLVVPLEADTAPSRTMFLDVSDPVRPTHLPALDIRGVSLKAGAAAVTRLPNGHHLCAVYRDEGTVPSGFIDFYLSATADLAAGFKPAPLTWWYRDAQGKRREDVKYQSIALLLDAAGPDDPAAQLYLVGTENTARGAPVEEGTNAVDLYRVDIGSALTDGMPELAAVTLTHAGSRTLQAVFGWGNLAAVGGVHVDSCGRLNVYAGAHWRQQEQIRFTEYRCRIPDDAPAIDAVEHGWIELYEHPNFKGRRLTILGTQDGELTDYRKLAVQGGRLDNQVSSVRFQLPPGIVYRLFDGAGFKGESADLAGTGGVVSWPDLRDNLPRLADRVSSSRFVPATRSRRKTSTPRATRKRGQTRSARSRS